MISTAKKLVCLILAVCVLATCTMALAGCSSTSTQAPDSGAAAKDKATTPSKKLVVGYDKNSFNGADSFVDSSHKAFIAATLNEIGWEADFVGVEFAEVESAINNNEIDCFWDAYTIQGREDKFAWSAAYMKATPILIYRSSTKMFGDVSFYTDAYALTNTPDNKKIGVLAGSVTYEDMPADQKIMIDNMRSGDFIEYPGYAQLKDALMDGEIDLVLCEAASALPVFYGYTNFPRIIFTPTTSATYGVAFKQGSEEIAKKISEALRMVYADGTLRQICYDYEHRHGSNNTGADKTWKEIDRTWILK